MARSRSAAASAHQRTLEDLRLRYPDLAWVERDDTDTEEILADVSQGKVQFTLASSTEFALNRSVHPELAIALDLSPERALTWVVSTAGNDSSLLDRVNAFFVLARHEGVIAALLERYYGEDDRFDYLFSRNFMEHLRQPPAGATRPGSRRPRQQHGARLAAARGDGLPGIEVGSARRFVHRRARPDAADRGHRVAHAGGRPSRSTLEHLRRRQVPGDC